jgi:hypothetical protein
MLEELDRNKGNLFRGVSRLRIDAKGIQYFAIGGAMRIMVPGQRMEALGEEGPLLLSG